MKHSLGLLDATAIKIGAIMRSIVISVIFYIAVGLVGAPNLSSSISPFIGHEQYREPACRPAYLHRRVASHGEHPDDRHSWAFRGWSGLGQEEGSPSSAEQSHPRSSHPTL